MRTAPRFAKNFIHGRAFASFWKRGSLRSGSNIGSSRNKKSPPPNDSTRARARSTSANNIGDFDAAIAALPHLLEVPAGITPALLQLEPLWDPLRGDPRFQKLANAQP